MLIRSLELSAPTSGVRLSELFTDDESEDEEETALRAVVLEVNRLTVRCMDLSVSAIRERIAAVSQQIASAAPRPIDLVAVTNSPARGGTCRSSGGRSIRWRKLRSKCVTKPAIEAVRASGVSVQFIGQLQTNKVRMIAGLVDCIASGDRAPLVAEIAKRMPSMRYICSQRHRRNIWGMPARRTPELITCALDQGLIEGLMASGQPQPKK